MRPKVELPMKTTKLKDLGYNEYFEKEFKASDLAGFLPARVIAEYKEAYRVKDPDGEYLAKITGKHIYNAKERKDYPAVGDWVVIEKLDKNAAVIRAVLPRKTVLQRKYSGKNEIQIIAANVDFAFIVESLDRDFNLNRFERYFILANEGNIKPVIVLNKTDLIAESELNSRIESIKERFGAVDVITTSAVTDQGLKGLTGYIQKGKTYCFLGSSGVGKSTLINKLLGKNAIRTKEISEYSGRGKHTTSGRDLYLLENGGMVIDNPGMREVGIADASVGIDNIFDEITELAKECKFDNCTHTHEPGCAVLKAIEEGILDERKYENYAKLKKEAE